MDSRRWRRRRAFTATGVSGSLAFVGDANLSLVGGVGAVKLQKSYDCGQSWITVSRAADGTEAAYDLADGGNVSVVVFEPEKGMQYRVNCTAYTSGAISYRLSW